jgi:hypothetical protein
MNITRQWLKDHNACQEGIDWWNNQGEANGLKVVKKLIAEDHLYWANWLIVRVMQRKQYLKYAIFAAEEVIGIYERAHPDNNKPRQAIEAAKEVLKRDSKANRATTAATAAATAAYAAATTAATAAATTAATAAATAAYTTAYTTAATAAATTAATAAYATAAYAAYAIADDDAAYAAINAKKEAINKILGYGISLLTHNRKEGNQ